MSKDINKSQKFQALLSDMLMTDRRTTLYYDTSPNKAYKKSKFKTDKIQNGKK